MSVQLRISRISPVLKPRKIACWGDPQSPGITIHGELRV